MNISGYAEAKTRAWDLRFLELATLVSSWSKDPSTQTGAVIVRPDRTVASIGFNGFPKQMDDAPHLYEDRQTKYQRIIHCEMNALLHVHESVKGYTLYTVPFASCDRCAVHMIQAGIERFVYPPSPADKDDRWKESLQRSESYMDEAGCTRSMIAPLAVVDEPDWSLIAAASKDIQKCNEPHPLFSGVHCMKALSHRGMHATNSLAWGTA